MGLVCCFFDNGISGDNSVGFLTLLPTFLVHRAVQMACRHTPFRGFQSAKHGPSRHKTPLWAFTALPLPSQVTANTLPCSGSPLPAPGHVAILHLEGFKTRSTAHHDTKPLCGPLPPYHCLPRSPRTRCPAAAALCQRLAMSPYSI